MPGLIGVIGALGPDDARRRFDAAVARMLRHGRLTAEAWQSIDGSSFVGHVHLDRDAVSARHTARVIDDVKTVMHGVLYRGGNEAVDASGADEHFVEKLEGEFCLAVLDVKRRRLLIASDPVGHYPLYWRNGDDGFVFGSDLSAVLRATLERPRLNLEAVADYVTAGAVYGRKTLAKDVQLLDPGTILTYDFSTRTVSERRYDRLEDYFVPKATDKASYIERLRTAFKEAVDRIVDEPGQIGLSLSGGLDSRAILSAVNGRAAALHTYTLGIEGCADQAIAHRMAAIAGTQHTFFTLDRQYLRDFLPNMARMVSITDGMYLSHGLTEMLALQFLGQTGISVLLRGHGGELAKAHLAWPFHTDPHVYTLRSTTEVARYLSTRANYITPGLSLNDVLVPEAAAAAGAGAVSSYAAALEHTGLTPAESCSFLYLHELNRRFTVPSLELFRTQVEVRLPYLDRTFLQVLLAAPAQWRDSTSIHQALTANGIPKLLKVRNSNTGASADASPAVEALLDKANSLLKRLNVPGYRHYHNFDVWMRDMLLQSVEAELLGPDARVLSFVRKPALEGFIADTKSGRQDRSYLLQVLLILELWQRENGVEAAA